MCKSTQTGCKRSGLFPCHTIMGAETGARLLTSLHHKNDGLLGEPRSCSSSYSSRTQIYLSVVPIPRTHHPHPHQQHVWAETVTHLYCFAQVPKADDLSLSDAEGDRKLKNISRNNNVIQLTQQICIEILQEENSVKGESLHTADLKYHTALKL